MFDLVALLPHSDPTWIPSLSENLASSSLQDWATELQYNDSTTIQYTLHPAQHRTPGGTEISVGPGNSPRSFLFSNPVSRTWQFLLKKQISFSDPVVRFV